MASISYFRSKIKRQMETCDLEAFVAPENELFFLLLFCVLRGTFLVFERRCCCRPLRFLISVCCFCCSWKHVTRWQIISSLCCLTVWQTIAKLQNTRMGRNIHTFLIICKVFGVTKKSNWIWAARGLILLAARGRLGPSSRQKGSSCSTWMEGRGGEGGRRRHKYATSPHVLLLCWRLSFCHTR